MSFKAGPPAGGDDRQLNHTGTSEDGCGTTLALQRKKARRVSFAEMTSVHFFDREEEETPPESVSKAGEGNGLEENELNFLQLDNLKANDDGEDGVDGNVSDDDEDGELALRSPFLRPMESPSPGSTIGSATSNDEDHFFGPVSPNFIRPGRLSDSAASDDNHDITMDSTAFSIHFRSLARSESGIDLKTPTGMHLSFEEKTPTCTQGSSMALTVTNKPISNSSSPAANASGISDSSDMSLIGEHSRKYEYGRLSPDLDALLAEGQMELDIAPSSDNINASTSPTNKKANYLASKEDGCSPMGLDESGKQDASAAASHNIPSETLHRNLDRANGALGVPPLSHATHGSLFPISNPPNSGISVDNGALLPNQLSKDKPVGNSMETSIDASEDWRSEKLSSVNCNTLLSPDSKLHVHGHSPHKSKSPLTGFLSPSPAKRRLILTGSSAQKYRSMVFSSQADSFIEKENVVSQVNSASMQKSISKLERLKASAFSSVMGDEMHGVLVRSLEFTKTPPFSSNLEVNKVLKEKCVDASIRCAEEQLSSFDQIERQETQSLSMDGKIFKALLHDGGKNYSPLISEDPEEKMLFTSRTDSLQVECIGEEQATGTPLIHYSPVKSLEKGSSTLQKFLRYPDGKSRLLDQKKSSNVLNETCEIAVDFSRSKNDLSVGLVDPVLYGPAPFIERNSNGSSLETPVKCLTHGSGSKDLQPQKFSNITSFSLAQDVQLAPFCRLLDGPSNNSAHKRRNNELLVEHRESQDEIITLQRSPKLQKYQSPDISACPVEVCSGKRIVGTALKSLGDIKSKFMESANQLASSSAEKLNVHRIDLLQEFIQYMHKSKRYEMLHHELLSQKTSSPQNLQEKRTAEARLLMCRIVHEKAKLHLMHVKREKLLEECQTISCGVQECKSLKLNSLPQLSTKFAKGLQIDINGTQEVACNKVSTMMHALEVSDRKVTDLNKYFQNSLKMKGELNCNDTIALVKEYLVKRKCCRFFCQEMQMVVIQNMWSTAGLHTVVLNYLGILIQSLKIAAGSTSSIIISNEFNDMAITKSFPNMDACPAFAFVLPAKISRTYVGARSLAQEIQVTQSVLGNLVDVVQEVQLAQIELNNLIDTCFCSPTAGELDLQLHFISFKSGIKFKATLGLSFLNRGIYPSEIIPSLHAVGADGANCTEEPLVHEVEGMVKSVKPGYMRIIRLCRSISKAVQASRW